MGLVGFLLKFPGSQVTPKTQETNLNIFSSISKRTVMVSNGKGKALWYEIELYIASSICILKFIVRYCVIIRNLK